MADRPVKFKKQDNDDEYSWILYFTFASSLIFTLLFLTGIYKSLLLNLDSKFSKSDSTHLLIRNVLIDQKDTKPLKETDEEYFLSDKDSEASGKLTPEKGFENISRSRELRSGGGTRPENERKDKVGKQGDSKETREEINILNNQFFGKIVRFVKKITEPQKRENVAVIADSGMPSIPSNYQFKKEFAFSWDRNGNPVIPTVYYKHFQYFKDMLDKIQENWAIPGGNWFPVFDPTWNSGTTTFQSIPDQEVDVVFSLDPDGNVVETRLIKSMGYESLERACLDAINRSGNFGPPPKELFEGSPYFILPFRFRLVSPTFQ